MAAAVANAVYHATGTRVRWPEGLIQTSAFDIDRDLIPTTSNT